jgi:hypothetical protein
MDITLMTDIMRNLKDLFRLTLPSPRIRPETKIIATLISFGSLGAPLSTDLCKTNEINVESI